MSYLERIIQDLEKNGLDPHNMKKKIDDFDLKINDNASNINKGKWHKFIIQTLLILFIN